MRNSYRFILPLIILSLCYISTSAHQLDFSYAGYKAGNETIPDVPIKVVVPLAGGDATFLIQCAIDYVGTLPLDKNGFRGAVLLLPGKYEVAGSIELKHSGIVLRGSGVGGNGTKLIATGKDRRTLIRVSGIDDRKTGDTIRISDEFVPVNALSVRAEGKHNLKAGDKIYIHRPSVKEWIEALGTNHFGGGITALGWKPGEHDLYWDRTIAEVKGDEIVFDAPITTALDEKYGGGNIIPYSWQGRITNIGIENMALQSEYDTANPKDEDHSWMAVTLENVEDAWVRNMEFRHFAGSAVMVLETARRITVENSKSLQPVSEIGGQRRYTFFTSGQQCLFQRLYAEEGYHDFALGFCATGPNVFVQCHSELPYSFSGPVDSWASGVLFDIVNVNGNALRYTNRGQDARGAGWNAANSVFWQCTASRIDCYAPPTAQNYSFGSWAEFAGDGYWEDSNNHIQPRSLYYSQLEERLKDKYSGRSNLLPIETEATSSPSIPLAAELTKQAYRPPITLPEWIDSLIASSDIPVNPGKALVYPSISDIPKVVIITPPAYFQIMNGWLVTRSMVLTGLKQEITWWSGSVRPAYLKLKAQPHITRFVPGRTGIGLTDDLYETANYMRAHNAIAIDHNYGLWYDRRRDDHERIRRIDGEVWPPFYEQPFARSGQGIAYDGLSKYDLTKYNHWYWMRLARFAEIADNSGLILFHQNYFQHNIIEAGAHWADSPWRPANNINDTGFPEPAPYAGDKRIFLAEQFYDITHPVRKQLHRNYIRQCLDNFKDNHNVIQFLSEEYTGPLHFMEFWLDVISEWQAENGIDAHIALSATKDVQDAILADPVRRAVVDIIDIRYWFYRDDGTVYAPSGGQNLAPRQHARLEKPGRASFQSVYRAVEEYRTAFPDKAITYYAGDYPQNGWAVFMAGGSLAAIPQLKSLKFLKSASQMRPMPALNIPGRYVLGDAGSGLIIYSENKDIGINLSEYSTEEYNIYRINPFTGEVTDNIGQDTPFIIWIDKK